jgi:hypothetical protein
LHLARERNTERLLDDEGIQPDDHRRKEHESEGLDEGAPAARIC